MLLGRDEAGKYRGVEMKHSIKSLLKATVSISNIFMKDLFGIC